MTEIIDRRFLLKTITKNNIVQTILSRDQILRIKMYIKQNIGKTLPLDSLDAHIINIVELFSNDKTKNKLYHKIIKANCMKIFQKKKSKKNKD